MGALTFFRLKAGLTDPDDIIKDRSNRQVHYSAVALDEGAIGHLYLKRVERKKPAWLAYFGNAIDLHGVKLKTASLAAVMLVKVDGVFFAVVFGYGSSLLADGVIERRFGLRATLNAVDPGSLRSVDHKRLEATSRHTREQLTRSGALDQFGLDVNRDLLRGITGAPTDKALGKRLTGADQLTVVADLPLKVLPTSLKIYGTLAEGTAYKTTFPWVDNIEEIREVSLTALLDKELSTILASGGSGIWLAPPEVLDWENTLGFKYLRSKHADVEADLSLSAYFAACGSANDLLDGRRLTQDRIYHVRADSDTYQRSWPVAHCLVGELTYKGHRYVLNEGMWYRIDKDYLLALEKFVAAIPATVIDLPDHKINENEGAYNIRAHKRAKSELALMDMNFIQYPKRGKVEVCDLYSKRKIFVHVKKLDGSSTLSHLFNQGAVSAELLRDDPHFRKEFLAKLPSYGWGESTDPIAAHDFEVSFAIIRKPGKPLDLPFFSKVSLRTAMEHIGQLGFKVSLIGIPST